MRTGNKMQAIDAWCAWRTLQTSPYMYAVILRINQSFLKKWNVTMKKENKRPYDKHEPATGKRQVNTMPLITHKSPHSAAPGTKWLRRACTTGFVFFLAKGLLWIAATVWVIY